MKFLLISVVWFGAILATSAVSVGSFINTNLYIRRSHDIVVAQCVSIPDGGPKWHADGLYPVEVNIERILKGDKETGRIRIATIYPMEVGRVYLLSNSGGLAHGTDFLAIPQLAVVPLPRNFDLQELDGNELKEQVQNIFSGHLLEIEGELEPLLRQKALLEKAIADRRYDHYESNGPVKIGRIVDARTKIDPLEPLRLTIEFDGEPLEWSETGRDAALYFHKVGTAWTPHWEFAPCVADRIEDLVGKPLTARFYNMHSPGRAEIGWPGGGTTIRVNTGDVLLARTTSNLERVFIIKIAQVHPRLWARYAIIQEN